MNRECDKEINEAEQQIYELEQQQLYKTEFKKYIDTIRRVLHEAKRVAAKGIINKEFVDKYIDKIFATPEDGCLRLQIKIFTGETTEKYLSALRSRTDHTFKHNISPIEVKSGESYTISSINKFRRKYAEQTAMPYVLHTKDFKEDDGIVYLPLYMTMFL